jgi:hypothetical protein
VEEAFRLGACGYIFKTDAGKELLAAINAVRHGERFVSSRFASRNFGQSQGPDSLSWPAPNPPHTIEGKGRHEAVFYSDDRSLLENVTQFVGAALKARNAAIVVAIESHRDSLVPMLYAQGLDMGAVIRQGRYVALDAADTLSTLIVNGKLDSVRFMEAFTNLILTATKAAVGKHPRVAVFGEGAHLLWTQGNVQAAVRDEELCNQLTKRHDVDILCSYRQASFQGDVGKHVFQQICSEHSAIYSR